jgi:hypothetical protein
MKKILALTVTILTLSVVAFAQRRGPESGLKTALGLMDGQVAAIKTIIQNGQPTLQADRAAIKQHRQLVDSLLNSTSPVAQDVGNAAITLHAAEARLKADETALLNQVKQQLTAEQLQKLDTIQTAGGGRELNLLELGRPGRPNGGGPRPQ